MLNNVLTAHMTHDENLAEVVRNNDKTIDETYNVLFRDMLNYMIEDENNIPPCMHLHFISYFYLGQYGILNSEAEVLLAYCLYCGVHYMSLS